MLISEGEIADALIIGWKNAGPILTECEARVRASFIWSVLSETGLEINIQWETINLPGAEPFAIPIYRLSGSQFNVHHGFDKPLSHRADGIGLNEGDLFKLARACMLRATRIRDPWRKREKERFASHTEHLALIEELLWLGRFHYPTQVKRDQKLLPGKDKDVDFRFRSKSCWLNIEAKFRPGTWVTKVVGSFDSQSIHALFDKVEGKFPTPAEGEFNLICVTGYAGIDETLSRGVEEELSKHPEITGLVYWAEHAPTGRNWSYYSLTSRLPELTLSIDREEFYRASRVRHPVENPKTGRPIRSLAELPDYLNSLAVTAA